MTPTEKELLRRIKQLEWAINASATRGVVARTDDASKIQRVQVELLADETEDDVEHFQPQGLSFAVEPGAEAVCVAVGGDRAHTIALSACDGSTRPTSAKPGTGGLYTKGKWRFFIDADGVTHVGVETGEQFIARAQDVQDQFDVLRARIDLIDSNFQTFQAHDHLVATAGSPSAQTGTAAPTTAVTPPNQPLSSATPVASSTSKTT